MGADRFYENERNASSGGWLERVQNLERELDELRAELRSSDPQTPGMLQLVPKHHKRIEKLEQQMTNAADADYARSTRDRLEALEAAMRVVAPSYLEHLREAIPCAPPKDGFFRGIHAPPADAAKVCAFSERVARDYLSGLGAAAKRCNAAMFDADLAESAVTQWAQTPDNGAAARALWEVRKAAYVEGYKQAMKDADAQKDKPL